MTNIAFAKLDDAIKLVSDGTSEKVFLEQPEETSAEVEYLGAFAYMVEEFKSPDYPCDINSERWLEELEISEKLAAIWDFDYYQLSLVLNEDGIVVLTRHNP